MKSNKYNKRLKYRKHPDLTDEINCRRFLTITVMTAIVILLKNLVGLGGYSTFSKSLDFASTVTLSSYMFIVKPNIYNGKIKAYYRRDYERVEVLHDLLIIMASASISRFLIMSIFKTIKHSDIHYIFTNVTHPVATTIVPLIFILMIYFTFFNDKYTTIEEFSNKVNYEMLINKKSYRAALNYFYMEKDKEYNVKEFDGTYFDYEDEIKEETKKDNNTIRREMREENDRNIMDERNKRRL